MIALGSLNTKASVSGTEKIPVSGAGNPAINANLIRTYYGISGLTSGRIVVSGANIVSDFSTLTFNSSNKRLTINEFTIDNGATGNYYIGNTVGNLTGSGQGNLLIGRQIGTLLTTGEFNIGLGYFPAQGLTTGSNNIVLGHGALAVLAIGGYNFSAGFHNQYVLAGDSNSNVSIGEFAFQGLTLGNGNIGLGGYAGEGYTSGDYSVFIGYGTYAHNATANGQLNIQNAIFGSLNTTLGNAISTGNIGIYIDTPTARLHLPAGAATANKAPIKLTSGTNLTTAETGAVEYNGTNLFFTRTGTTRENIVCASAVNAVSPTAPDRTITVNINGTTFYIHAKTTND